MLNLIQLFIHLMGKFACFFVICFFFFFFFKIHLFDKFLQEQHQSVKQFESDWGPNCLQRLSADNKNLPLVSKEQIATIAPEKQIL